MWELRKCEYGSPEEKVFLEDDFEPFAVSMDLHKTIVWFKRWVSPDRVLLAKPKEKSLEEIISEVRDKSKNTGQGRSGKVSTGKEG